MFVNNAGYPRVRVLCRAEENTTKKTYTQNVQHMASDYF